MTLSKAEEKQDFLYDPNYPDPTLEMLDDPLFNAIWNVIKKWDISRYNDGTYAGATGNDARKIYDALKATYPANVFEMLTNVNI